MMKINIFLFYLTIFLVTNILSAQKNKNIYKVNFDLFYEKINYSGTYEGTMIKTKINKEKIWVPDGKGKFNGHISGSGVRSTLIFDNFDNFNNSALSLVGSSKPKNYSFDVNPNDDFSIETSISLSRNNSSTGGAKITIFFDDNKTNYLEIRICEFEKETFYNSTANVLDKTAYKGAKLAFKNLQVNGSVADIKIEEKMKSYGIDFSKNNKLKITKNNEKIEILINEKSEGSINLPSNVGVKAMTLDKDETHNVFYDFISVNKVEYNENEKLNYDGTWAIGNFEGSGILTIGNNLWQGNFIQNELTGEGVFKNENFEYYGNFENGIGKGIGRIITPQFHYYGDIDNFMAFGNGTMQMKDMSNMNGCSGISIQDYLLFNGVFSNNLPDGFGKMTFKNGDTLVGEWYGLMFTGKGKVTLNDGSIYIGEWKQGTKDGKGKLIYPNRYVLEGEFINDEFNGFGKIVLEDGGVFEGKILSGKPNGQGTVIYPNGDKLTGDWNEFGFSGQGRRNYEAIQGQEGQFCYEEGQWKNGKLNGKGKKVFQFKIGDDDWLILGKYEGDFIESLFNGQGILEYYDVTGDYKIDATWINGQSTSGNVTITSWSENSKSVSSYSGELTGFGIANGFGKLINWDGSIYEGEMKNGVPNGQGTRILSNKQVEKGTFIDGEFKKPFQCKTATIGDQIWMAENLAVTSFRNGDPIQEVTNIEEWRKAEIQGKSVWCNYNFDPKNGDQYGKLYNWFAVIDSRGLAPEGWHISSKNEWKELINFLGGEDFAGKKLKHTIGWANNGNGLNKYGFSALPGGSLLNKSEAGARKNFIFEKIGDVGYWWSSTNSEIDLPFSFRMCSSHSVVTHYRHNEGLPYDKIDTWKEEKGNGMYIRCLKDN